LIVRFHGFTVVDNCTSKQIHSLFSVVNFDSLSDSKWISSVARNLLFFFLRIQLIDGLNDVAASPRLGLVTTTNVARLVRQVVTLGNRIIVADRTIVSLSLAGDFDTAEGIEFVCHVLLINVT